MFVYSVFTFYVLGSNPAKINFAIHFSGVNKTEVKYWMVMGLMLPHPTSLKINQFCAKTKVGSWHNC